MAFAMVSLMQLGGRARSGWVLAGLLLLPALVLNPWTAERLFSPDGEIGSPTRMALLAWDGLFIGAALLARSTAYFPEHRNFRLRSWAHVR